AVTVLALRVILPQAWSPWLHLGVVVLAGGVAYVAVLLLAHQARMQEVAARVIELTRVRHAKPSPAYATAASDGRPRLLLISYHFPPDAAVGALRWQKLARYAAERGWGLDVITLDPACLARTDPTRTEDLPAGVRIYGIPARPVWVERAVEVVWHVLDPARRLRGWPARPAPLGAAAGRALRRRA